VVVCHAVLLQDVMEEDEGWLSGAPLQMKLDANSTDE